MDGPLRPGDLAQMRAVAALRASLDAAFAAVHCVVCQDSLVDPCQLSCCHLLCSACFSHALDATDNGPTPCPVCRARVVKRAVRPAPLPLDQIVASFTRLDFLLHDAEAALVHDRPPAESVPAPQPPPPPPPPPKPKPTSAATAKLPASSSYPVSACALCPRGVDPSTVAPGTDLGPLRPVNEAAGGDGGVGGGRGGVGGGRGGEAGAGAGAARAGLRVHEECAFFADKVHAHGNTCVNVEKALRAAKKELCAREACGRKSAAILCAGPDCHARYHYVCAVADGCKVLTDGSYTVFCPEHSPLAPDLDMDDFALNLIDPDGTQGRESPDECRVCGKGGDLMLCDGCNLAYHVVCAELPSLPAGRWSCGICAGTHEIRDVAGVARYVAGEDEAVGELPAPPIKRGGAPPKPPPSSKKPSQAGKRKSASRAAPLRPVSDNVFSPGPPSAGSVVGVAASVTCKRRRRSGEGPVILPTGLNSESKAMLVAVQKRYKHQFAIASDFSPRVTHVLVDAYLPGDRPTRTVKLCKGIVANLPIVCFKWVEDAVSGGSCPAPSSETYAHGMTRSADGGGLFAGQRFYFSSCKDGPLPRGDLMQIVKVGMGTVVTHEPTLMTPVQERRRVLVVRSTQGVSQQRNRRQSQSPPQLPPGCEVVTPEWILDECVRGWDKENREHT